MNSDKENQKTLKSLKEKDVVFIKADKNTSIVVLNKTEYNRLVHQMINKGPYTQMNASPLPSQIDELNTLKQLICNTMKEPKLKYKLKSDNPRLPILYATVKTHKPTQDMRPISSNINTPYYNVSKWLINEFKKLPPPKGRDIKNSMELVNILKDKRITRNEMMVSFDVKSLYPSIPIDKAMVSLHKWLIENKVSTEKIDMYVKVCKTCITESVFQFRDGIYKQNFGLSMGNPLSSFIANLYMCEFETKIQKHKDFPRVWIRYVDDVFAIINRRKINNTKSFLNSIEPSIQFTHEEENQNKIPFLEVTIQRNEDNTSRNNQ